MAVAAYAAAIFVLSIIPIDVEAPVSHLDKAVHLCEYLLFAWLLMQAVRAGLPAGQADRLPQREYVWLAWMWATSYGLLIELLQGILPWRSGDLLDVLANALGAWWGVWLGERLPPRDRC